ncbi:NACHT domain-containing protein [Asanoa ferruginea]|uniref:NACHT domain-containing protein n=1 Tax=Asanoa ferruginea TaxID=53367 RepID=A0A3D9ZSQ5_9ACTN|nr:NACHT domain-containing protein [Asanoa ferruginea]REF99023.1 NACHT domain-containing protein [Asanoa ferruginea]GIF46293.1 ATP-binding protein [Asanoa ferruginea]
MSKPRHESLAKTIVFSAFKLLFPSSADRIDSIRDISSAITGLDKNSRAARALPRRLEEAADHIALRLERIDAVEFPDLDEDARDLAVEGVVAALKAVDPTVESFVRDAVTEETIYEQLRPEARKAWQRADLGDAAVRYGGIFLREACAYVVGMVRDLPGFDSEVVWETYIATHTLDVMLEAAIGNVVLPQYRADALPAESRLEAAYRTDIVTEYKHAELIGLDLPAELRRQPVRVAYMRLRSTSPRVPAQAHGGGEVVDRDALQVDATLGRAVKAAAKRGSDGVRILLTGTAGSGKTTITQWLAITLAEQRVPATLSHLQDCVPVVVQLRHVHNGGAIPSYASMVRASAHRANPELVGWIEKKLDAGRAVVIFDGLDELAPHDVTATTKWIEKVIAAHPAAHYVVTSRPDNIDYRRFATHGFQQLSLLDTTPAEAQECVRRWFKALISASAADDRGKYVERRDQLLVDLRTNRNVIDLSKTPLLCAMLSALYANRLSGAAPDSRVDLYDRVVTTLVDLRERGKKVPLGEFQLAPREKLLLLQSLAAFMSVQSKATIRLRPLSRLVALGAVAEFDARIVGNITEPTALEVLDSELKGMVAVRMSGLEVLDHFLDRSVVFQRIGDNQGHFVHRSIQEFLTGRAFGYRGDVEGLLRKVDSQEWRRVVAFAAGTAGQRDFATRLVRRLLATARPAVGSYRDILLLAAECVTAAGQVDPEVAEAARTAVSVVLPPRSVAEADLLPGLGEALLPWLEVRDGMSAAVIEACVAAAARVGGPAALTTIGRHSQSALGHEVAKVFVDSWGFFDASAYAMKVLRNVDLRQRLVPLRTADQLTAAATIPTLVSARVETDLGRPDLTFVAPLRELRDLDAQQLPNLRSAAGVGSLTRLRRLNLSRCPHLADISAIADLHALRDLYLNECPEIVDLTAIGGPRGLRVLCVDGAVGVTDFSVIAGLSALTTLSVTDCDLGSLDVCAGLPQLRTLRARTAKGVSDVEAIGACGELRRLELRLADGAALPKLPPSLTSVRLSGQTTAEAFTRLASLPDLRHLAVYGAAALDSIAAVGGLPGLVELCVTGATKLQTAAGLRECRSIEVLDLSGAGIWNLDFLEGMRELRRVTLDRCTSLRDISGLHGLPKLEHVSMTGGVQGVSDDAVLRLRQAAAAPLSVDHDPFPDLYDRPYDPSDYDTG